jgi:hypothetical protein
LIALGFAWNKGYVQQWTQQLKPLLSGKVTKAPEPGAGPATTEKPAPAKEEKPAPAAK